MSMFSQQTPPPVLDIAGIQDQQLSSNQQAVPVPYVAGTRQIAVTWVSQVYKLVSKDDDSGGKGGKASASGGKKYIGSAVGVVMLGTADDIVGIQFDNKSSWPGSVKIWATGQAVTVGQLRQYNSIVWECVTNHTTATNNAPDSPAGPTYWTEFTMSRGSDNDTAITVPGHGTVRIYWGRDDQTQATPSILQGSVNGKSEDHPNYKGLVMLTLEGCNLGTTPTLPNVQVVIRRNTNQSVVTSDSAALTDGQINPLCAKIELLVSDKIASVDSAIIDATAAQDTADYLFSIRDLSYCSPLFDAQSTLAQMFEKLDEMGDTFTRWNPQSKKIEFGVFKHGATPDAFTIITIDDLVKGELPKFSAPGWTDVKSRAVVRFNDRAFAYQEVSDKADDLRAYRVLGAVRSIGIDRPFITRRNQALAHAIESLRTLGRPAISADSFPIRREKARSIRPGDYVRLDIPIEPGGTLLGLYCRVTQRTISYKGPIRFSLIADSTLTPVPYAPGTAAIIGTDDSVPAIENARIIQVGNALLGVDKNVIVLAERPDTVCTGFDVWFDTNPAGNFSKLGTMFGFAGRATLRSNIDASVTTIPITVPTQADMNPFTVQPGTIGANNDDLLAFLVSIDSGQIAENANGFPIVEICSVSAQSLVSGSNYNLTVLRGRKGTSGNAFLSGAEVWIIPRSLLSGFLHEDFQTLATNRLEGGTPTEGQFKLVPFTFVSSRDIDDCDPFAFLFPIVTSSQPIIKVFLAGTTTALSGTVPVAFTPTPPLGGYGIRLDLNATDSLGGIVEYTVYKFLVHYNTADVLVAHATVTPTSSLKVSGIFVPFGFSAEELNGATYEIKIFASDNKGNVSAYLFRVLASYSGGSLIAGPSFPPSWTFNGRLLGAVERGYFGELFAQSNDGRNVYWQSRYSLDGVVWSDWSAVTDQSVTPAVHGPLGTDTATQVTLQEFRTFSGDTDVQVTGNWSSKVTVQFVDFQQVTG